MVLTHEGLCAEIEASWQWDDGCAPSRDRMAAVASSHAQYRLVLKALLERRAKGFEGRNEALARRFAAALGGSDEASRGALVLDGGPSAGCELLPGGARGFCRRAARARGYTLAAWVREATHCGRFEAFAVGQGGTRVLVEPRVDAAGVTWVVEVLSGGKSRGTVSRVVDDADGGDDGGAGHGGDAGDAGLYAPRWPVVVTREGCLRSREQPQMLALLVGLWSSSSVWRGATGATGRGRLGQTRT